DGEAQHQDRFPLALVARPAPLLHEGHAQQQNSGSRETDPCGFQRRNVMHRNSNREPRAAPDQTKSSVAQPLRAIELRFTLLPWKHEVTVYPILTRAQCEPANTKRHGATVPFFIATGNFCYCELGAWLGIWLAATFFGVER